MARPLIFVAVLRTAAAAPERALHLPDRQRGPAGQRGGDAAGHQLLRRRQRPAELPGHQDHDAERQRRGLRRQRGAVHRPGEVPRLHPHDGRRPRHLLQEPASGGRRGATSPPGTSRPAPRSPGPRSTTSGWCRACATPWRCTPPAGRRSNTSPPTRGGKPAEPYVIVGDRVRFKGDDRIFAGGKVTVDRSDFASRSDSLRLDTGAGSDGTLLGGKPMLRGIGADSFSITGNRVDLKLDRRELTYLLAKGNGRAISKEWDLVADTIAPRRQPAEAGADARLGRQHPALGHLAQLRDEGRLAGARYPGAAAPGSPRLRQGVARRHRASSRPRTATGCGATPRRPVRQPRFGRHPARGAEPDRGPAGGAVLPPRAQPARCPPGPRSTMPGATPSP